MSTSFEFEIYRRSLLNLAQIYQKEKHCLGMLNPMRKLVQLNNIEFTREERDLLFTGYQDVIARQRSVTMDTDRIPYYEIQLVQSQLLIVCNEAIAIINNHMIPSASDTESLVRYHTKKGDYYRYLAEVKTGDEREELGMRSLEAYQKAIELAEAELPVSNEARLSAAVNMSVLLFDVMGLKISAMEVAENAYSKAALEIRKKETSEKSKIIWKLLLDNVALMAPRLHPNVSKKIEAY